MAQDLDFIIEDFEDDDLGADDFAFVIGSDGELKNIVVPVHLMEEPPEEVIMILKFFGIDDINMLENRVLH